MKFLAFNLAVGAALFFLFTADKSDIQSAVNQAHGLAEQVKEIARKSIDQETKKEMVSESLSPVPDPPVSEKLAKTEPPAEAVPIAPVLPEKQVAPPPPAPSAVAPTTAQPSPKVAGGVPTDLDPAVAKRRAEVLGDSAPPASEPVLKKGEKLMSSSDRRRELLSLAEEMELLYAKSISR
ncbi:MAG: hypothetical protein CMM52_14130 [Rhodospirillaceae bacterium]|nr:hypothetical protein [Rhodospirillaceae bacterium]|tara:strand:+ start:42577 stop:43116 length:540 start_codon:yes stop_codon:yes gene_type:complete